MPILLFVGGVFLGWFFCAHLHGVPSPHDECDVRYETMCKKFRAQIKKLENELQTVLRGMS